jgi:hypothetical protein
MIYIIMKNPMNDDDDDNEDKDNNDDELDDESYQPIISPNNVHQYYGYGYMKICVIKNKTLIVMYSFLIEI